jgi:uncharacterized protein
MAAYARRAGGDPVPLATVARDAGMAPDAAREALNATGLFTAGEDGVVLAEPYRRHAGYFRRQVERLDAARRLAAGPAPDGVPAAVRIGAALFNAGLYFEAHEYWEDVWRASGPPERQFYHGLVQAAAGCYHAEKGNPHGTSVLLRKAREKLAAYGPRYLGVDVAALLAALQVVRPASPLSGTSPRNARASQEGRPIAGIILRPSGTSDARSSG